MGDGVRAAALALVGARYTDFGPTLAHEKLVELHGFANASRRDDLVELHEARQLAA